MTWFAQATYFSLLAPNLIFNVWKKGLFEKAWLYLFIYTIFLLENNQRCDTRRECLSLPTLDIVKL